MKLLKRLSEAFGGSGQEAEVAAIVAQELRPLCRTVRTDPLGNVVGVKPGRGARGRRQRIMLAAHMDEIGFVVSHIDDERLPARPARRRVRSAHADRPARHRAGQGEAQARRAPERRSASRSTCRPRRSAASELTVGQFFVDLGLPRREGASSASRSGTG